MALTLPSPTFALRPEHADSKVISIGLEEALHPIGPEEISSLQLPDVPTLPEIVVVSQGDSISAEDLTRLLKGKLESDILRNTHRRALNALQGEDWTDAEKAFRVLKKFLEKQLASLRSIRNSIGSTPTESVNQALDMVLRHLSEVQRRVEIGYGLAQKRRVRRQMGRPTGLEEDPAGEIARVFFGDQVEPSRELPPTAGMEEMDAEEFVKRYPQQAANVPHGASRIVVVPDGAVTFYRPETLAGGLEEIVASEQNQFPGLQIDRRPLPASAIEVKPLAVIVWDKMLGKLPYTSPVPVVEHQLGQPFPYRLPQLVAMAVLGRKGDTTYLLSAWTFEHEGRQVLALAVLA